MQQVHVLLSVGVVEGKNLRRRRRPCVRVVHAHSCSSGVDLDGAATALLRSGDGEYGVARKSRVTNDNQKCGANVRLQAFADLLGAKRTNAHDDSYGLTVRVQSHSHAGRGKRVRLSERIDISAEIEFDTHSAFVLMPKPRAA